MPQIIKINRELPIFELLENMCLPVNGELQLPIRTWKRKNWVTKKYVFRYDEFQNQLEYMLSLYEHELTYGTKDEPEEHIVSNYEAYVLMLNEYDGFLKDSYIPTSILFVPTSRNNNI